MFFEIRFPDCPYTCPGWMNESTPLLKQKRWAAESPWRAPLADLLKQDTSSAGQRGLNGVLLGRFNASKAVFAPVLVDHVGEYGKCRPKQSQAGHEPDYSTTI